MRIAYVCADAGVPVFGCKGCSIHVQEILRALIARGARVEVLATRFGDDPLAGLETVRVHKLQSLFKNNSASREQAALALNDHLHASLERAGPFDLVYERYSLWSFAAMEYAYTSRVPGVLEVNAPLIEEQVEYRGLIDRSSAEQVAERVFGAATVLLAVSAEVAAYLQRYPAARGRVHVIPNAVNPDRFPPDLKPVLPARPGTLTVGFAGSLKPWHGLAILAEAFDRLHRRAPNTRLLIVGDGLEHARLVADLTARGLLGSAHFTGAVAPSEVPGLLASMDVGVAPYPQHGKFYFSPLKVYEYMAAGLAVVASRIGQLSELIQEGVNGLLCAPGDPIALAAALDRLRCEPALRSRLGRQARATVLREYTWEKAVRRILHVAGLASLSPSAFAEVKS